jgi:hypothetical protein
VNHPFRGRSTPKSSSNRRLCRRGDAATGGTRCAR